MSDTTDAKMQADAETPSLTVLIVDDHPVVLSGCRAIVMQDRGLRMIEATDADTGFAAFTTKRPDVCVIDVNLPGRSGFDLGRRILQEDPDARLIFFSMNDDPAFAMKAIEAGAKGYLSKTDDPQEVLGAIREVAGGGVYLAARMARKMAFRQAASNESLLAKLNPREMEILRLIARGQTVAEIAGTLGTSYKTIANTVTLMKRRFSARTTVDLARIATEAGLG
jgi:DNA-binding NarL/FixJ family response regulator